MDPRLIFVLGAIVGGCLGAAWFLSNLHHLGVAIAKQHQDELIKYFLAHCNRREEQALLIFINEPWNLSQYDLALLENVKGKAPEDIADILRQALRYASRWVK